MVKEKKGEENLLRNFFMDDERPMITSCNLQPNLIQGIGLIKRREGAYMINIANNLETQKFYLRFSDYEHKLHFGLFIVFRLEKKIDAYNKVPLKL